MNLQKLITLRNGHRSVITRQLEKIEEAKKNPTLTDFHTILEAIQLKAKVIESLNEKILPLTDVNDIEDELVHSEEYSLDLEIKLRNLQLFGKKEVTQTQEVENSNSLEPLTLQGPFSDMNFQHTASFASSNSQFYRLPKLTIPTFNGDILKWQTFWDSFESTVHTNINLTDVQKFSYLQSQLEGDAARVIEGFPLTNANYGKAVELLQERFGQKCKVIHAYMQSLLQLSPPSSNIHSLRNFYDKMEAYIRGLESLGQAQDSFGNLLVPVVIGKLPADIRRQLAREHSDGNWMLQDLRMAIFREINILEAGNATEFSQSSMLQSTASFLTNTYNQTSTDANVRKANYQNGTSKNSKKCAFCEEQRFTNDCTKIVGYSERIDIVKKKKLCYNCLGIHQVSKCKSTKRCRTCKRKHHTSICNPRNNNPEQNGTAMSATPVNAVLQENEAIFQLTSAQQLNHVVLKTAVAPVCSSMYCVDTNILFDEGAQRSFITEKLATTLQLTPDGTDVVKLATFGDTAKNVRNLDTATVYVKTDSGEKIPIKVLIVPMIATPLSNRYRRSVTSLTYLRGLKLAHPVSHDVSFEISLLIGADNYLSFVQEQIIRGDGPTAVQSKLGYLLSGPLSHCDAVTTSDHVQTITSTHIQGESECNLERFWSLESMGISDPTDEPEKTKITEYQQHAITFSDGKYTAKLPWKPDHPALPSNYNVTKRRTENTIRRLRREPEILKKYGEIITEQEKRGFIEQIEDLDKPKHPVHYLPHHPVKKESATTPIRIVYDCSCRESQESPSLNDCLESTPPELNDLTSIIMRFRYHRYAVSTDIEKAFLQIRLDEKDRDVTRFLWLTDASNPDSSLTTYRFRSVLFGATCSPFILNATILKHLSDNPHIPVAELLQRDIYVDNILSSLETEEDVLSYYRESRALMTKAGFNLRSWTSNSSRLKNLATKERVYDSDSTVKTLGMRWNPESDTLQYSRPTFRIPKVTTKRHILQESSKIFDPLGLLSPVTVRAKLLIQDLWKEKHPWDSPLSDDVKEKWESIGTDLNSAADVTFSRHYFTVPDNKRTTADDTILHVFVDASMRSYGAAAYLSNRNQPTLVIAKNRVAPLKKITLPRLELMAAVVGARLARHIQNSLPVTTVQLWSDSQIVLYWLRSAKPLKRFVENRVQEIRQLTDPTRWSYCPTDENPADLLTRGISADKFKNNSLWWNGPSWLPERLNWPQSDINVQMTSIVADDSLDADQTLDVPTTSGSTRNIHRGIHTIIDVTSYSNYKKLLRVTSYVARFLSNCRTPRQKRVLGSLTVQELKNAEMMWILDSQSTTYSDVKINLKSKAARLNLVRQLRLFLDEDDAIRCGGRIHNAPLNEETKFPYLLSAKHPITRLIVYDTHTAQLHAGVTGTITQLRQRFWIPCIRQTVKSIIHKCVTCRKVTSKPFNSPDPPPLPKSRLSDSPPFSVTGVDFTGALYVKNDAGQEKKVYVCLFTCASTRAVHLEVVPDLTEDSFLQAFRRFASRKSLPVVMISDNASTYIAAANHLKQLFDSPSLKTELSQKGVEWKFIPKRAPWYGGFWERLIGITKTTLKKVLGRSYINMEKLQTVVTEVEGIMNDRPLTHVSSSVLDPEPLTPSHLLFGRRLTALPYPDAVPTDVPQLTQSSARKRVSVLQELINKFWTRWRFEYLTALREHHTVTGSNQQHIKIGDVVQVHDETPRSKWKLVVIKELIPGNDGFTRAAKIQTVNGITNRPIVKLYPLEVV